MPLNPTSKLVVAVTGHRVLRDSAGVAATIRSELVGMSLPPIGEGGQARQLTLVSCLAEGVDRIAAHEALRLPGGVLRAILPLAPDDYESDFISAESRAEFRSLLARAADVEVLPPETIRVRAYRAAGCRAVDVCDILLAVWDGRPARGVGGTAEVVSYARECGKTLVIVDSEEPVRVVREGPPGR